MKDLIIVGAGGFGREAYYMTKKVNAVSHEWNMKGFLSDIPVDLKAKKIDLPVIGTIKDWQPAENEVFVMGVSSPIGKEKIASLLKDRGARFVTVIDPKAAIVETAEIGEGCVIGGRSSIGDCARLGNFVHVFGSVIGQDSDIGDYTTTTAFVNVAAQRVGKRCFLWSHSVILKEIEDDSVVSVGSIVISKVKKGSKVWGYPAHKMEF